MVIGNIVIRDISQLCSMDNRLADALKNLTFKKQTIPLVYQYLHNPNKTFIIDIDNTIGKVFNIRRSSNGIIADIQLNDVLTYASNFTGKIDNMMADFNPNTNEIEIKAFIVYDKVGKENCIKQKTQSLNKQLPKPGEIPFMPSKDNLDMKCISEELINEYNKFISSQNSNSE